MKMLDILNPDAIVSDLKSQHKLGVIEELAAPIAKMLNMPTRDIVQVLMEREQLGSTGIGQGIGIPHGKLKDLDAPVIGFGLSKKGVDFDSLDDKPTHLFFTLITPDQSTGIHLKLLGRISRILKNDGFINRLMNASNSEEIFTIIKNEDDEF
jgi:PTS system nitrogen regulatory IIA component